jgi:hypothetical protein
MSQTCSVPTAAKVGMIASTCPEFRHVPSHALTTTDGIPSQATLTVGKLGFWVPQRAHTVHPAAAAVVGLLEGAPSHRAQHAADAAAAAGEWWCCVAPALPPAQGSPADRCS